MITTRRVERFCYTILANIANDRKTSLGQFGRSTLAFQSVMNCLQFRLVWGPILFRVPMSSVLVQPQQRLHESRVIVIERDTISQCCVCNVERVVRHGSLQSRRFPTHHVPPNYWVSQTVLFCVLRQTLSSPTKLHPLVL